MPSFQDDESPGSAFLFPTSPTGIRRTSSSWAEPMLCGDCETKLNRSYDSYGIGVLKGQGVTIHSEPDGIWLCGIESKRLRAFFLSILWRASISSRPQYAEVKLEAGVNEAFRQAFQNDLPIPWINFEVGLYRLRSNLLDPPRQDVASREFIISPRPVNYGEFASMMFTMFGFVVEICFPKPPKRLVKNKGRSMLKPRKTIVFAPFHEFKDFPPLVEVMEAQRVFQELQSVG